MFKEGHNHCWRSLKGGNTHARNVLTEICKSHLTKKMVLYCRQKWEGDNLKVKIIPFVIILVHLWSNVKIKIRSRPSSFVVITLNFNFTWQYMIQALIEMRVIEWQDISNISESEINIARCFYFNKVTFKVCFIWILNQINQKWCTICIHWNTDCLLKYQWTKLNWYIIHFCTIKNSD